jgi:hypothetical protein
VKKIINKIPISESEFVSMVMAMRAAQQKETEILTVEPPTELTKEVMKWEAKVDAALKKIYSKHKKKFQTPYQVPVS